MNKNNIRLDDWGKGLLVTIINRAIGNDKDLTRDDIEKLKEIKKLLQGI